MAAPQPFWQTKRLDEMSAEEWESLCDGCGKCCLIKLEYEETGEIAFTDVACHQLDCTTGRCKDYARRQEIVPDCVVLTPENLAELTFMPPSCAYRRLSEGKGLADWHPLVSGRRSTVHTAGMSVRHRARSENEVPDCEMASHIARWPLREG
jgi:uncharacterized cysteine cluster protein YcgN (CxxCxxCC family)